MEAAPVEAAACEEICAESLAHAADRRAAVGIPVLVSEQHVVSGIGFLRFVPAVIVTVRQIHFSVRAGQVSFIEEIAKHIIEICELVVEAAVIVRLERIVDIAVFLQAEYGAEPCAVVVIVFTGQPEQIKQRIEVITVPGIRP